MRLASRAVFIHEGRIHEIGPPGKVFAAQTRPSAAHFLGVNSSGDRTRCLSSIWPLGLRIGPTDTSPRNGTPRLMPLLEAALEDARAIILAAPPPEAVRPQRRSSPDLLDQLMAAKIGGAGNPPRSGGAANQRRGSGAAA